MESSRVEGKQMNVKVVVRNNEPNKALAIVESRDEALLAKMLLAKKFGCSKKRFHSFSLDIS